MMEKNVIIINLMFSGEYLDDNIGHEIINLYRSDDGKPYVYLCKDGKFNAKDKKHRIEDIKHVVNVRRTEKPRKFEILSVTRGNLEYISTKDLRQWTPLYGGKSLGRIFQDNLKQQDVNVTFLPENVFRPGNYEDRYIDIKELSSKMSTTKESLRIYIDPDDCAYEVLEKKISGIITSGTPTQKLGIVTTQDTVLTYPEVYGILNRELPYSDALKFFIDRYHDEFMDFFVEIYNKGKDAQHRIGKNDLGIYMRTVREWRNIDLIVEFSKKVFVIENKIFSKLNGVKKNSDGDISDQLDKYYSIMERIGESDKIRKQNDKISFMNRDKKKVYVLLTPDHNVINLSSFNLKSSHGKWKHIFYSELNRTLKQIVQDPNLPEDPYLKDFQRAVSFHSDVNFNYTMMKKRFIRAIQKTKGMIAKSFYSKEDLVGKDGIFTYFQISPVKKHVLDRPLLILFNSNPSIDEVISEVNENHDIAKLNVNPEQSPAGQNLNDAKLIVWHKYVDQFNITDLETAVKQQKKLGKQVLFFANTYSLPEMTLEAEAYIQNHFHVVEYTGSALSF